MGADGEPVEHDETYIGGYRKKWMQQNQWTNKVAVFGIVERNGRVTTHQVKSVGARVLIPIIERHVVPKATIYSDTFGTYKSLSKLGYSHTTVNHSTLEYVRGNVHTNTIEGYWSNLKNSLRGTYHSVSPKYLQSYLNEFAFRYNFRDVAVCPVLLERAAKHV